MKITSIRELHELYPDLLGPYSEPEPRRSLPPIEYLRDIYNIVPLDGYTAVFDEWLTDIEAKECLDEIATIISAYKSTTKEDE